MRARSGIPILLITLLLIALPVLYEINVIQLTPKSAAPVVLVIGNTEDKSSFAGQARAGIEMAMNDFRTADVYDLEFIAMSQDDDHDDMIRLFETLSRRNVCMMISCQNSPDVPALLNITRTFRIPTVLLVATNSELTRSAPELTLRFPPSDEDQSACLAQAVAPTDTVAVVYENNNYGRGLAENLRTVFGDTRPLLEFLVDENSEITPYLLLMTQYHCDTIIYAGYYQRAFDLIRKLGALHYRGRILLSDGCFSDRLAHLPVPGISLTLSFPTDPFPDDGDLFRGYWGYGYDIAQIAKEAIPRYLKSSKARESLLSEVARAAFLNSQPSPSPRSVRLIHKYAFSGPENRAEHFAMHEVALRQR